jgi:enoyl-[acyl-carrier protein] reductase I
VAALMLEGKRLVITGVLTNRSIAFAVAREAQLLGAEVVLTGFGRRRRLTERAAQQLPTPVDVLELDVNEESHLVALAQELEGRWGTVDGLLHAIAFAPEDAMGGRFVETRFEDAAEAFRTSAYSLQALARHLGPLLEAGGGGSVVGLDADAAQALPGYDWMGVAKAALESISRYLALSLGPRGIRVNLVASGPIDSPAAAGVPGFRESAGDWSASAPLGWDVHDPTPVAHAVCFLFSDFSRAISGELLHVDGGRHAITGPVPGG